MTDGPLPTSYDKVPYTDGSYCQTHPARLATVATVFGLSPPPVANCRVLELGCGTGGNLLAMAVGLPEARFVGVDLSSRQIDQGREAVAALGLANVRLCHGDLGAIGPDWGTFDYIVCHGVYSWVPAPVREQLLAVCRANLAPNGVAYVSYNVLPGWRLRGVARDFMLLHAEAVADPAAKLRESLATLALLAQGTTDTGPYRTILQEACASMRGLSEAYLFHEMLEPVNDPVYFRDFVAAAGRHGLAYLGETSIVTMMPGNFPGPIGSLLRQCADDVVRREQYVDFVLNRKFRETLLVDARLALLREPDPGAVRRLLVASRARPTSPEPALAHGAQETFRLPGSGTLETRNALTKAAMLVLLDRWPQGLAFDDLVAAARARCAVAAPTAAVGEEAVTALAAELTQCYTAGVVDLHAWMPTYTLAPSARPTASPLARRQAACGAAVVNLCQQYVEIEEMPRRLLQWLDGSRDRDAVVEALAQQVRAGAFQVTSSKTGQAAAGDLIERAIGQAYDHWLPRLAQTALLVS